MEIIRLVHCEEDRRAAGGEGALQGRSLGGVDGTGLNILKNNLEMR